jgi:hypothetical protein
VDLNHRPRAYESLRRQKVEREQRAKEAKEQARRASKEKSRYVDPRAAQIQRDKEMLKRIGQEAKEEAKGSKEAKEKAEQEAAAKALEATRKPFIDKLMPRCSRVGATFGASYSATRKACRELALQALKDGHDPDKITDEQIKAAIKKNEDGVSQSSFDADRESFQPLPSSSRRVFSCSAIQGKFVLSRSVI